MTNQLQQELRNDQFLHELRKCIVQAKKMRGIGSTTRHYNQVLIDEYLTEKELNELKGIYLFSKAFANISGNEIEEFIKANEVELILGKFIRLYPGLIDEMRRHGLTFVCLVYRNLKAKATLEELDEQLDI